jgi:hypothetical protein
MWIMTPTSFISIVAHRSKPDVLLVRARLKGDIKRLFPAARVSTTPTADYRYRAEVAREVVGMVLSDLAATLAYTNVKGAIPKGKVHARRDRAMHATWSVWNDAQKAEHLSAVDKASPSMSVTRCDCGDLIYQNESCGQCGVAG